MNKIPDSISWSSTKTTMTTNPYITLTAFIRSQLECPVCLVICIPPIYQCQNGHLICKICHDKVDKCAICRARLVATGKIRNLAIEQVAEAVHFPCPNKYEGCDVKAKIAEYDFHGLDCQYGSQKYCQFLISKFLHCHVNVKTTDLTAHLVEAHRGKTTDSNQVILKQQLSNSNFYAFPPVALNCFGRTFVLKTEHDQLLVSWKIVLIGSSKAATNYLAKICLYGDVDGPDKNPKLTWQGMIDGIDSEDQIKSSTQVFQVQLCVVKGYAKVVKSGNELNLGWAVRVTVEDVNQEDGAGMGRTRTPEIIEHCQVPTQFARKPDPPILFPNSGSDAMMT